MKSAEELGRQLDEIKEALLKRDLKAHEIEEIESELQRLETLVASPPKRKRTLRDLRGVGKDLWRSVDVEAYLREERRSWR